MQAIQDFLFPIVLFVFYFFIFSRFFTNDSHNDLLLDPVVNLDVVDHGLSDNLPDVEEDEIEDGGENDAQQDLERLTVKELRSLASSYGLKVKSKARKGEIIQMLKNVT